MKIKGYYENQLLANWFQLDTFVFVTFQVESAGCIWVLSENTVSLEQLHFIESSIMMAIESGESESVAQRRLATDSFPVGEPVLAPHTDRQGATVYRRAQVRASHSNVDLISTTLV